MKTLFIMALLVAATCQAHEGMVDRDEAPAAAPSSALAPSDRPRCLPGGELYLPKAAQRALGIRTAPWSGTAADEPVSILATVQPQPAAVVAIAAPEPGRLEAASGIAGGAWPLPGRTVHAGEILAWLHPLISQRDAARRRAELAGLDQKLVLAELNVGRLKLQGAVNANQKEATGNIYLEEAVASRDALVSQRALVEQSLSDRVPVRAAVSGSLLATPARSGDVVTAGQILFQLSDPSRLRLAAPSFDAQLGARVRSAQAQLGGGATAELAYRGQEPLSDTPGWQLLFDLPGGAPSLSPGQLVSVRLRAAADGAASLPPGACALDADGAAVVWIHRAPERFAALRLKSCTAEVVPERGGAQLAQGDRLVTHGAGLLTQYR